MRVYKVNEYIFFQSIFSPALLNYFGLQTAYSKYLKATIISEILNAAKAEFYDIHSKPLFSLAPHWLTVTSSFWEAFEGKCSCSSWLSYASVGCLGYFPVQFPEVLALGQLCWFIVGGVSPATAFPTAPSVVTWWGLQSSRHCWNTRGNYSRTISNGYLFSSFLSVRLPRGIRKIRILLGTDYILHVSRLKILFLR